MTEARLYATFSTQISVPSLQDGASIFRISLYEARIINKSMLLIKQLSHAVPIQNARGCTLCGPPPTAMGLGPVAGQSENRCQLPGSAPQAKQQALRDVLHFLPAMKSEQPVQTKRSENLRNKGIHPAHGICPRKLPQRPFQMLHYDSGKKTQSPTPRHAHVHTNPISCSAGPATTMQKSKQNSGAWPRWPNNRSGIVTDTFP